MSERKLQYDLHLFSGLSLVSVEGAEDVEFPTPDKPYLSYKYPYARGEFTGRVVTTFPFRAELKRALR